MFKTLLVGAAALTTLAACGSNAQAEQTLTEYCVAETVRVYEELGLPFTIPVSARPAQCDKWMAEENITTKAGVKMQLAAGKAVYKEIQK